MTETLSLRAKIEQSPMGAYQWMIVVMAAIMNLLDGFDVLALAFTATAIRGEFGLTFLHDGYHQHARSGYVYEPTTGR